MNRLQYIFFCLLLSSLFHGCSPKEEPKISIGKAITSLEHKCQKDFDTHVITKLIGETLWVYLPTKEPLFDYEATKETYAEAERKPNKFTVQFAEGKFNNNRFNIEYDIINRLKIKSDDFGYNSTYTDAYSKLQNNLFTAIYDVFFNAEAKAGEKEPRFCVLVVTDIKKGIETRTTFYLQDFKRLMTGDLPNEEYAKRFLAETKGGQSLIGDETGTHITYKEISMTEFLCEQMVNRINFKFMRSDFPPGDDYDKTIAGIVADTLRYYEFKEYDSAQLFNLRQNKKLIFEKKDLASLGEDAESKIPAEGKLIHVRFDNGQAEFIEDK